MKQMIKAFQPLNGNTIYVVCNDNNVSKMLELFAECGGECISFSVGEVPLDKLPDEIQAEVKECLRVFNEAHVTYENREFHVSTSVCLCAHYADDHFVCGTYKARDVYTPEQRKKIFIEEFGYSPCGELL